MQSVIESDIVENAVQALPARARVGIGLASAERVMALLQGHSAVYSLALRGLEDAWTWVNGAGVKSLDMYNQIDPLAYALTELDINSAPSDAALSVVSALYYATGEIASYEPPEDLNQRYSSLGSDMADVGTEDLVECLGKAASSMAVAGIAAETEVQWQQQLINRLLSESRTDDPDQLGPPIRREYFQR